MQLTEAICFVILTITVAATSVRSDEERIIAKDKGGKKISKRDTVLIDNFPLESMMMQNPNVIFRRVSRQRYVKPKPIYGLPHPKFRPSKQSRRPVKKYRGKQVKPKYGPPASNKNRAQKPRYGPPNPKRKPIYGSPKKYPQQSSYIPQEPAGFGEPPSDYNDYQPLKNYKEPPTDSYGAPLKLPGSNNVYTSGQGYPPLDQPAKASFINSQDYALDNNYHPPLSYQAWQKDQFLYDDSTYAHSHKYVRKAKPYSGTHLQEEAGMESPDNDFIQNFGNFFDQKPSFLNVRKKKPTVFDNSKMKDRPKALPHQDQILVGGQYAEPPARYVPKFQPSAPMYAGNDFTAPKGFVDSEMAGSNGVSSYVNYKNSNMAFSPQNLNDAFSIID